MIRPVAAAAIAAAAAGCVDQTPFVCTEDAQCVSEDLVGNCESNGFCSFPDEGCESGRRFGEAAGDDLGGQCVEGGETGCAGNLELTAGSAHTCALDAAGNVFCWGADGQGQLGNDLDKRTLGAPASLDLLPPMVQISAGNSHTCGVARGGELYCWGDNSNGQLGTGSRFNDHPLPVLVAGDVSAVSGGDAATCFVTTSGQLFCMGDNEDNELGDGSGVDQIEPVAVEGLDDVTAVALGTNHTCALRADATVACWGANLDGQLGDGTMEPQPMPIAVPGLSDVVEIALGDFHSCARTSAGQVLCWGRNSNGQLGDGTETARLEPTPVPTVTAERLIASGDHSCAVEAGGQMFCWGENNDGELGDGTQEGKSAPAPVPVTVADPLSVAAGDDHSCAQDESGVVRCWGLDLSGQLGTDAAVRSSEPLAAIGVSGAVDVATGGGHTCAVLATGAVQCWGRNDDGQLGAGDRGRSDEGPRDTLNLSAADFAVATSERTCVHEGGDAISCFGGTANGLLGNGSTADQDTPAAISASVVSPVSITLGVNHSCALAAAGDLFCWGNNTAGKLGDGTTNNTTTATAISAAASPSIIAAGDRHTCAVDNTGATLCWGGGLEGQLGDGNGADTGTGAAVTAAVASTPSAVALGSDHSCAILADDSVSCWGANDLGQVGSGSAAAAVLSPAAVSGLDSVAEIASDSNFSCARKTDGSVWCWGENDEGELGAGLADESSAVPVQVTGISDATAIAAGADHACAVANGGAVLCWGDNTDAQLDSRRIRFTEPRDSVLSCQ